MDRTDVTWRGYWPAAPTPFAADGRLDEEALRALVELYVEQGVHGMLVNGSTGEWFSQSPAERRRVASIAVQQVAGRCPVVIGVSAYTAIEAAELARHAASIGADGVLATVPPYVHPDPDETLVFYQQVSGSHRPAVHGLQLAPWSRGRLGTPPACSRGWPTWRRWSRSRTAPAMGVDDLHRRTVSDRVVFGSFLHRRGCPPSDSAETATSTAVEWVHRTRCRFTRPSEAVTVRRGWVDRYLTCRVGSSLRTTAGCSRRRSRS